MSKKHSMPEMKEGSVNVTPLIDVVMCLIIFFMLVAKIGVSTGAAKMELPETILGKKIEDLGDTLMINVMNSPMTLIIDPTTNLPMKNAKGQNQYRKMGDPYDDLLVTAMVDQFQGKGEAKEIKLRSNNPVDPYPFRRVLEMAVKGDPKKGLKPNPDFSVTVRAEKDIEFRLLQLVLAEIAQAGVKNQNYAAVGVKMAPAAAPAE
jgi:biopolymer transport protein ExbD